MVMGNDLPLLQRLGDIAQALPLESLGPVVGNCSRATRSVRRSGSWCGQRASGGRGRTVERGLRRPCVASRSGWRGVGGGSGRGNGGTRRWGGSTREPKRAGGGGLGGVSCQGKSPALGVGTPDLRTSGSMHFPRVSAPSTTRTAWSSRPAGVGHVHTRDGCALPRRGGGVPVVFDTGQNWV